MRELMEMEERALLERFSFLVARWNLEPFELDELMEGAQASLDGRTQCRREHCMRLLLDIDRELRARYTDRELEAWLRAERPDALAPIVRMARGLPGLREVLTELRTG